jgi:hypothetical protein
MSGDWKTLRVPADKYEEAKAQKEANDRTWGEQIVRPADDAEEDGIDYTEIASRTADEVERRLR